LFHLLLPKKDLQHHNQCPYCGCEFDILTEIHTDHIYPLSKGGLEDDDNLVLVCSSCNLKKSDYTLREFIIKFKLDRDAIEGRLELLGKRF
jgi:5-methylcytosine-specific restriction endonuclease McrA